MNEAISLNAADRIGARLVRDAIWSGDRCNWLGDAMEFSESRWQVVHKSFGPDLYSGTSGIALFLAFLFDATKDDIYKKAAEGAVSCAVSQLDRYQISTDFGFYSGLTGIAYALTEVGRCLNSDAIIEKGLEILEKMPKQPALQQTWDVVSGSAGVVPALLRLYETYRKDLFLEQAVQHGDALITGANCGNEGWSWKTIPNDGGRNLTGFSHGTAGIAWAFSELHRKSSEPRFLQAAQGALRYERHWYDARQENWPDFRSTDAHGQTAFSCAWCHGAPGIGLSRARLSQILSDEMCRAEAEAGTRTTTKLLHSAMQSRDGNYSLCHGNFGNAETLLYASDVLSSPALMETVWEIAAEANLRFNEGRNPWPCGVLNGGETPGLMLGLAGIGYFYLRMHDRKTVPSILMVLPQ